MTTEARRLYVHGVDAYAAGRYEEAERAFARVHELKPAEIEVLRNLGSAEIRAGHTVQGARHLARWLRESSKGSSEERAAVTELLHQAEARLGRLRIEVDAAGAEVAVDGEAFGVAPLSYDVHVSPGEHVVMVSIGAQRVEMRPIAIEGAVTAVSVELTRPAPAPSPLPRPVVPATKPAYESGGSPGPSARVANVLLVGGSAAFAAAGVGISYLNAAERADEDERELSQLVDVKYSEQPCGSECAVQGDARDESNRDETIGIVSFSLALGAAAATALVLVLPEEEAPPERGGRSVSPLVVGGSIAAVGLATGVVFTLAANSSRSEQDALREDLAPNGCSPTNANPAISRCAALFSTVRDYDRNVDLSRTGFAVAAASALGTAAYWFWPRSASRLPAQPSVHFNGAQVFLTSAF